MSLQAVDQFLQKITEDSQLQEELAKAMESENDRQAVVELAARQGYQFTGEELMQEIQKRQQAAVKAGELSEDELETVAGGATPAAIVIATATLGGINATIGITKSTGGIKW